MINNDTFCDEEMYLKDDETDDEYDDYFEDPDEEEYKDEDKKSRNIKKKNFEDPARGKGGFKKYHKKEAKTRYLRKHRDDIYS